MNGLLPLEIMDQQLKTQQQFYDDGWHKGLATGKEQRGNLQTNLEFLARTNILKESDRILEIGCGIGTIVSELTKQGYDIIGTDISREAVRYGLDKYGKIKIEVMAAEELDYKDNSFDVVLSFDLFEHIAQTDRHLHEVSRVLSPGGHYLLQTPNKFSNAIFETLAHKSLKWRRSHPSLHTPSQLIKRLASHGFETRFVKMNPINEFTIQKLKRLGPVGNLFRRIDFTKLPMILQTNIYAIAHKTK